MTAVAHAILWHPMAKQKTNEAAAVGERLKKAREQAGYRTQAELADAIKVRSQTIWRIETGGHVGGRATLEKLADALKVSRAWLEHGVGEPPPPRTDQLEAIESYLKSEIGYDTPPDVARRLRMADWTVYSDGNPGIKEIHRVREAIESNLKSTAKSRDGDSRGK